MNIEIITKELKIEVYGFTGIAVDKEYVKMAFKLMDKMWQVVRSNNLENKGKNIWVYEAGHSVFAGIELNQPIASTVLERKKIVLPKYAYYKHTGPYDLIKQASQAMKEFIREKGYEAVLPYIEIYGHWTNDATKLETELLMCLQ